MTRIHTRHAGGASRRAGREIGFLLPRTRYRRRARPAGGERRPAQHADRAASLHDRLQHDRGGAGGDGPHEPALRGGAHAAELARHAGHRVDRAAIHRQSGRMKKAGATGPRPCVRDAEPELGVPGTTQRYLSVTAPSEAEAR